MKKMHRVMALVMAAFLLLTGCGNEEKTNPFPGKWIGKLDMTSHVENTMVAQNANLEKYAKFENLTLTLIFEFTEEELTLHVDEASMQQFVENLKLGVEKMVDTMVADVAVQNNTTIEKVYSGMGVTRDAYVKSVVEGMQVETMVSQMAEALELKGAYEYNSKVIVVVYQDDTYEEMKYVLTGNVLTISIAEGEESFVIQCEK